MATIPTVTLYKDDEIIVVNVVDRADYIKRGYTVEAPASTTTRKRKKAEK